MPLSILKPTLGIKRAETLRLWTLDKRQIISTIRLPDVSSPNPFCFGEDVCEVLVKMLCG